MELFTSETAILSPSTSKLAFSKVLWTREMESAFHAICKCISNASVLTIPLPEDAMSGNGCFRSGYRRCATGTQGRQEAAAFYSCQTRGAEQRYSAAELEALALFETIRHYEYYLYDNTFCAFTDHKSLCQLLTSDRLNGCLRRLGMKLQHWLLEVCYVPGEQNGMADAISREERTRQKETEIKHGLQSGVGGCGGTPHKVVPVRETKLRSTRDKDDMTGNVN